MSGILKKESALPQKRRPNPHSSNIISIQMIEKEEIELIKPE